MICRMAYGPDDGWSQKVSDNLREAIDSSEVSLNQLAKDTDIALSTLFRRYKGKIPWDTDEIEAVCGVLGVDPQDLMTATRAATA